MKKPLKPGDYVIWRWSSGYKHGKVVSVNCKHTEITSCGEVVARPGTPYDPALIIVDHNDNTILKLASEIEAVSG